MLAGLLLGKPVGILLFSYAARLAGASLPPGLRLSGLAIVGIAASIGFTVSLFFATAAFPGETALAETKMGALLSFVAAPMALLVSRALRMHAAAPALAARTRDDSQRSRHHSSNDAYDALKDYGKTFTTD